MVLCVDQGGFATLSSQGCLGFAIGRFVFGLRGPVVRSLRFGRGRSTFWCAWGCPGTTLVLPPLLVNSWGLSSRFGGWLDMRCCLMRVFCHWPHPSSLLGGCECAREYIYICTIYTYVIPLVKNFLIPQEYKLTAVFSPDKLRNARFQILERSGRFRYS